MPLQPKNRHLLFSALAILCLLIIAGVGFLGGGAILKSSDEMVIGLTTAASIWLVASLGVACGAGQWAVALIGFGIALVVLVGGNAAEKFVLRSQGQDD